MSVVQHSYITCLPRARSLEGDEERSQFCYEVKLSSHSLLKKNHLEIVILCCSI